MFIISLAEVLLQENGGRHTDEAMIHGQPCLLIGDFGGERHCPGLAAQASLMSPCTCSWACRPVRDG